ncbi:MAG TPA: hypothetical protein VG844_09385 [Terracidiphilus sp.]|nr:hypothetical protein [Terracidiphilus sp.]
MACINAHGELTESAQKILEALEQPGSAETVAKLTSLPLFRIRSGLREMGEAGIVEMNEETYSMTERGRSFLATKE